MKTAITILLTLFISFHCNSQIKVYLKNGEVKEGKIGLFKNRVFKLKQSKKGDTEKFKAEDTDSVLFKTNKHKTEVYHSIEYDDGKFEFYKLHSRGKLNAYIIEGRTSTGYGNFSTISYPIHKPNTVGLIQFNGGLYNVNWAEKASEYFSDCPSLAEKIKNRDKNFRKNDILNIVKYYNEKCN